MVSADSHLAVLRASLSELHVLSDAAWADAMPRFSYQLFPAGAHIVEAGHIVTDLYFQTSGLARFYYLHQSGKEFNKSFSTKGQVISSVASLVSGQPSAFYVQALASCECLALSYQDLLMLAEQHRDWNTLTVRLLEQLAIKKERREADFLLLSATEHYENFLQDYAHIVNSIANYHIASYLGITEVALSRIRRRLKLTQVNASANG
ncbi:MAG: Crp/Fnr family transcriptional regulator [Amphritea sp.]